MHQELQADEYQRRCGQTGRKPDPAPFLGCHLKARVTGYAVAAHAALTLERDQDDRSNQCRYHEEGHAGGAAVEPACERIKGTRRAPTEGKHQCCGNIASETAAAE